MSQKRIRDYGVIVGELPTGKLNKITDVKGVRVGHCTIDNEEHKTGVTVIMPCEDNIFANKMLASSFVWNGFGKTAGLVQIEELGLGVLKHRTHRPRQFPQRGLCHILAADHNSSRQRPTSSMLEQAIDKLDDCGLAAAALSGEQDKFPRFHRKGAVPKAWRLLALISIGHMVKDNHGSTPLQQIPPTQRAKNSSVTTTSWM